eukprot:997395-Rhodomonas_salina.3
MILADRRQERASRYPPILAYALSLYYSPKILSYAIHLRYHLPQSACATSLRYQPALPAYARSTRSPVLRQRTMAVRFRTRSSVMSASARPRYGRSTTRGSRYPAAICLRRPYAMPGTHLRYELLPA